MIRTTAFALLVLLTTPLGASAQVDPRFGAGSFLVGAGVLYHNDAVREFSGNLCPGNWAVASSYSSGWQPLRSAAFTGRSGPTCV
jgi:hypothetical protein